jgi:murein DD-endopeptidase MepM/ murein hydrolase activator NlpD
MPMQTRRSHGWSGLLMGGARIALPAVLGALGLLAVSFVLPMSSLPIGALGSTSALAVTSSELNKKLDETQAQLRQIRTNIAKAETVRKAALGDIQALDQSIDEAEKAVRLATAERDNAASALAQLEKQLGQVTAELNAKTQQLSVTEGDLRDRQEVLDSRLVNVYKSGGRVLYLAALLERSSFSELVGRIDLLSKIAAQDNAIVGQIESLRAKVEAQKQDLEAERARVTVVESRQKASARELETKAAARGESLNRLESARNAKQKVVNKAEKDRASWAKQEDALLAESARISNQLRSLSVATPAKAGKGILLRPVNGAVTSGFGYRMHPIFHVRKLHTGVDLHAGMGTPIHAAAAGTVIFAGWRGGYGKCVIISHGGGLATLYGHQSEILVAEGQKVKRGEVIGKVGSTGYSTGPHLHFEVRVNGSPVDPLGYL